MKKVVLISAFDWDGFLEETLKNLENMVPEEDLAIRLVDDQIEYFWDNWKDLDLLEAMRGGKFRLFVHFAVDNLDDAVVLADGTIRLYDDLDVVNPEDEDEYDAAQDIARQGIWRKETESVGFIFERHGNELIITSGWYTGSDGSRPPVIDELINSEELDFFGYAMDRYVNQYILPE